jgi:hypothetical protein
MFQPKPVPSIFFTPDTGTVPEPIHVLLHRVGKARDETARMSLPSQPELGWKQKYSFPCDGIFSAI